MWNKNVRNPITSMVVVILCNLLLCHAGHVVSRETPHQMGDRWVIHTSLISASLPMRSVPHPHCGVVFFNSPFLRQFLPPPQVLSREAHLCLNPTSPLSRESLLGNHHTHLFRSGVGLPKLQSLLELTFGEWLCPWSFLLRLTCILGGSWISRMPSQNRAWNS